MKRSLALILVLLLLLSSFSFSSAAAAGTQPAVYSDKYNSGTRNVLCTTLNGTGASDYYTGSNTYDRLDDLSANNLLQALRTLMTSTHKKQTSYADCRDYAVNTDCQNENGKVMLLYTGLEVTRGDYVSGSKGWNREHVWPKSLGGFGEKRAGADLHHIRPADSRVNSTRNNRLYGNVTGGKPAPGSSTVDGTVGGYYDGNNYFEPLDNVKGDVARICLYIYVRYGSEYSDCANITTVFQSVDVLLEWMEIDPVDTWEMGRNEVVEAIQGNRNVFIDYPELAWLLFDEEVPVNLSTPSGSTLTQNPPPVTEATAPSTESTLPPTTQPTAVPSTEPATEPTAPSVSQAPTTEPHSVPTVTEPTASTAAPVRPSTAPAVSSSAPTETTITPSAVTEPATAVPSATLPIPSTVGQSVPPATEAAQPSTTPAATTSATSSATSAPTDAPIVNSSEPTGAPTQPTKPETSLDELLAGIEDLPAPEKITVGHKRELQVLVSAVQTAYDADLLTEVQYAKVMASYEAVQNLLIAEISQKILSMPDAGQFSEADRASVTEIAADYEFLSAAYRAKLSAEVTDKLLLALDALNPAPTSAPSQAATEEATQSTVLTTVPMQTGPAEEPASQPDRPSFILWIVLGLGAVAGIAFGGYLLYRRYHAQNND